MGLSRKVRVLGIFFDEDEGRFLPDYTTYRAPADAIAAILEFQSAIIGEVQEVRTVIIVHNTGPVLTVDAHGVSAAIPEATVKEVIRVFVYGATGTRREVCFIF